MSIHTGVRYTHEWTSARTHASQVEADHAARIAAGHASRLAAVGMVAFLAMAAAPAAADEPVAEGIEAPVDAGDSAAAAPVAEAPAAGSPAAPVAEAPAAGSPAAGSSAEGEVYVGTQDGTAVEPTDTAGSGVVLPEQSTGRPGKSGVVGIPQQGGHPEAEKADRPVAQLPSQRGGQADDAIVDEVLGTEATAPEPAAPVAQRAAARVLPNTGPETTAAQTAGGFGLIAAGLALMGRRRRPAR